MTESYNTIVLELKDKECKYLDMREKGTHPNISEEKLDIKRKRENKGIYFLRQKHPVSFNRHLSEGNGKLPRVSCQKNPLISRSEPALNCRSHMLWKNYQKGHTPQIYTEKFHPLTRGYGLEMEIHI